MRKRGEREREREEEEGLCFRCVFEKSQFFLHFQFFPNARARVFFSYTLLNTQNDSNGAAETVVLPHVPVFFLFFLFQTSRASRCGGFEDDDGLDDDGSKKSPSPSFLRRRTVIIVVGVERASLV